jgi:hypothetical protein
MVFSLYTGPAQPSQFQLLLLFRSSPNAPNGLKTVELFLDLSRGRLLTAFEAPSLFGTYKSAREPEVNCYPSIEFPSVDGNLKDGHGLQHMCRTFLGTH